VSSFLKAHQHN